MISITLLICHLLFAFLSIKFSSIAFTVFAFSVTLLCDQNTSNSFQKSRQMSFPGVRGLLHPSMTGWAYYHSVIIWPKMLEQKRVGFLCRDLSCMIVTFSWQLYKVSPEQRSMVNLLFQGYQEIANLSKSVWSQGLSSKALYSIVFLGKVSSVISFKMTFPRNGGSHGRDTRCCSC